VNSTQQALTEQMKAASVAIAKAKKAVLALAKVGFGVTN
jgi:hypothetical protein